MAKPITTTPPRSVRVMLAAVCGVALVCTVLPPLVPPTFPAVHLAMWWTIAVVSAALAVLVSVTRRVTVLIGGWILLAVTVIQGFVVGDLIAMFTTWPAVAVLALVAGRLRPRPRKALLAAHAVAAACWIGVALAFVAMSVVAMSSHDLHTTIVVYELMAAFDITLLPWTNFATVLTGIALSLGTKWGLFQYYWVTAKVVIAVGILVIAFGFLHDSLESACREAATLAHIGSTVSQLSGTADVVLWGFGCSLLSLVGALLLSLYKPGGRRRSPIIAAGSARRGTPARPAPR